jgi:sugar phosphate isomerase/epimerase
LKLVFAKAAWELSHWPMEQFIARVTENGWDATEIYLANRPESQSEILRLHRDAGLDLIAQISTTGTTHAEHFASLREHYLNALECGSIAVNCQTGRDIFSFDDNRRLFEAAVELTEKEGIPIHHEIHRGRALFTGPLCRDFLEAIPGLRLTADVSHLFCVHESDLSDQPDAVDAIVAAADHVHARVGFAEGPQLADPRNSAYQEWVDASMNLWQRIRSRMESEGRETMTITPEFGPPPYAPLQGLTSEPVADPWEMNHWMRDEIRRRW